MKIIHERQLAQVTILEENSKGENRDNVNITDMHTLYII